MKKTLLFGIFLSFVCLNMAPVVSAQQLTEKDPAQKEAPVEKPPIRIEFKLLVDSSDKDNPIFGNTVLLSKADINSADVSITGRLNTIGILFRMKAGSKTKLQNMTTEHIDQQIALFVDGEYVTASTIDKVVTTGTLAFSGKFTQDEATEIVDRINKKD